MLAIECFGGTPIATATASGPARTIHTCALCGERWNPRYVSVKGCPYCRGTGTFIRRLSVAEQEHAKKARKEALRLQIEATYEVPDSPLPAWNVFWAFVYHSARARGTLEVDLAYCLRLGILRRRKVEFPLD